MFEGTIARAAFSVEPFSTPKHWQNPTTSTFQRAKAKRDAAEFARH
jgi:hypothetical protein